VKVEKILALEDPTGVGTEEVKLCLIKHKFKSKIQKQKKSQFGFELKTFKRNKIHE